MNSIIQKNIALNQRNQVQKEHRARVAAGEKIDRDWYSDDDNEDSDDDEDNFPSPDLLTQMSLQSLRNRQDELGREVVKAKTRATSALGFAALALFALGFTLLSTAVRHFTN